MVDTKTVRKKVTMMPAAGWFNVKLLIATGIQALITKVIGNRTAKREILAALDSKSSRLETDGYTGEGYFDAAKNANLSKNEDLWIDYIADIGDGFDATFSMAWLIGRDFLFLNKANDYVAQPIPKYSNQEADTQEMTTDYTLPAGQVTIFGGDEVYPYANSKNYFHRTTNPYSLARPWSSAVPDIHSKKGVRALFALPGNHDWYDGLSSFIRIFCQPNRWIGCWQVKQRRSYFSIKLPHGFWVWGIDTATTDDIDTPQLAYFENQLRKLKQNDQVILCVPKPAWVDFEDVKSGKVRGPGHSWTAWHKIEYIQSLITKDAVRNATVPVILSGDLHHYSRFEAKTHWNDEKQHLITSGGGGAFMSGTNFLPEKLYIPTKLSAEQKSLFPSASVSKRLRKGVFKFVFVHKLICTIIGALMLKSVWLVNASSRRLKEIVDLTEVPNGLLDESLLSCFPMALQSLSGLSNFLHYLVLIFIYHPATLALPVLILTAFIGFALSGVSRRTPAWGALTFGTLHSLTHVIAAFMIASGLLEVFNYLNLGPFVKLLAFPIIGLPLAWLINGTIFAGYILLSNLLIGLHNQEVFSAQSIEDWKGFLRLRVNKKGVTIYPIGVPKVSHKWEKSPHPGAKKAKKKRQNMMSPMLRRVLEVEIPKGTTHALQPREPIIATLIEDPIFIPIKPNARNKNA